MVEFLAYLGWIKVAESLLNPFGEDDEDFDIDYLIDRNIWVSYMIVDTATDTELEQDPFLQIKEENKVDGHVVNFDPDEDSPMIWSILIMSWIVFLQHTIYTIKLCLIFIQFVKMIYFNLIQSLDQYDDYVLSNWTNKIHSIWWRQ